MGVSPALEVEITRQNVTKIHTGKIKKAHLMVPAHTLVHCDPVG